MYEDKDTQIAHMELSRAWLELLGQQSEVASEEGRHSSTSVPALASDPWNSLVRDAGVEVVDLQKVHLPMNDQDVEQMLQLMQEQPVQHRER